MEDALEQNALSGSEELAEMAAFFAKLGRLVEAEEQKERETSAGLREFFPSFRELLLQKEKNTEPVNIFELCSLGTDEIIYCRILRWLLDENENHGYGNRFLKEILRCSGSLTPDDMPIPEDIPDGYLSEGYQVRTEVCPNSDPANRIDIVCDGKDFLLYIEVKVNAHERPRQIERYCKKLDENAHGRIKNFLYLWRGQGEAPADLGTEHYGITPRVLQWNTVASILRRMAENDDVSASFAEAVRQYTGCIEKFL